MTCRPWEGNDRSIILIGETRTKAIRDLPHYYTDVPSVAVGIKGSLVPSDESLSIERRGVQKQMEDEYRWLNNTRKFLEDESMERNYKISWAAFHANRQPEKEQAITPTALLPLFHENAHTVSMIKHSMDIIKSIIGHLNPGQTPVIILDQPLFTIAKQIQWTWPTE